MAAGGLMPGDEGDSWVMPGHRDSIFRIASIPHERLREFDRLMAQGGIEAVMKAIEREDAC